MVFVSGDKKICQTLEDPILFEKLALYVFLLYVMLLIWLIALGDRTVQSQGVGFQMVFFSKYMILMLGTYVIN